MFLGTSDHDPSNIFTFTMFTPPKSCMFGPESYLFLQYDTWQVLVVNSSYIHIQNILVNIFAKVNTESIKFLLDNPMLVGFHKFDNFPLPYTLPQCAAGSHSGLAKHARPYIRSLDGLLCTSS